MGYQTFFSCGPEESINLSLLSFYAYNEKQRLSFFDEFQDKVEVSQFKNLWLCTHSEPLIRAKAIQDLLLESDKYDALKLYLAQPSVQPLAHPLAQRSVPSVPTSKYTQAPQIFSASQTEAVDAESVVTPVDTDVDAVVVEDVGVSTEDSVKKPEAKRVPKKKKTEKKSLD
jgi:hypothetical protein